MKEYIYLNGKKSVEIEVENQKVSEVYIDGKLHSFEKQQNPNKENYAIAAKREKYAKFLNNQFENLVVLTGAGSSYDIGENVTVNGVLTPKKGKLMSHLWDQICSVLTEPILNRLCELVKYTDKDKTSGYLKNLEKLLSLANVAKNYVVDKVDDKSTAIVIEDLIITIEDTIKDCCTLKLPKNSPHAQFIEKITKRKVTLPRVKVFTLNYDTLFEQAGREKNFTIIDGFSFSHPRIFSGRNFDLDIVSRNSRVKEEDNFIQKVFHIYKPHGSIDWCKEGLNIVQKDGVDKPLMIFPKDSKYESSYEQPYFEMMARFQQSIRNENVLLICIGFSFNDKHVVTAIAEALEQNPSFQLMIVNKGIDCKSENFKPFFEAAARYSNMVLIDEEFADFANFFPDLKSYNQDNQQSIVLNVNSSINEPESI